MSDRDAGLFGLAFMLLIIVLVGLGLWGYVDNILTLISANSIGTVEIVRFIGIFIAPLGVLLGWFA